MSNTEIQSKVNELRELRRMADELTAEIESFQDAIKAHMTAIDADTLTGADYKITWKTVTSSRFDSTAFKKAIAGRALHQAQHQSPIHCGVRGPNHYGQSSKQRRPAARRI